MGKKIGIRNVWAHNLAMEFEVISSVLPRFKFISMDTEFPGVLFPPSKPQTLSPSEKYAYLKRNVDALKIIQLGLTLSDWDGNLPDLGHNYSYIWQFNFRDFDPDIDAHNPDSISLLRKHGINFVSNRVKGIDSADFARHMSSSGLLFNSVAWVTFQGGYDFGYLMKAITRKPLPTSLDEFMEAIRYLFGEAVYDLKHVMRLCDRLKGGLERVAKELGVEREVGECHQAGSDSLLTWRAFKEFCHSHVVQEEMDEFVDTFQAEYKATFRDAGVALVKEVKAFLLGNDVFYQEVQLLGRLRHRHRHLLFLKGFYMGYPLKTPLNWRTRRQIVSEVAATLEYLLLFNDPPIYRISISSSSVVLDENFGTKLSRVGALGLPDRAEEPSYSSVSTDGMASAFKRVMFQLGILILELITGQSSEQGGSDLIEWVQQYHTGSSMHKLLDPDLGNDYNFHELKDLLNVASQCIKDKLTPSCAARLLRYLQKKNNMPVS